MKTLVVTAAAGLGVALWGVFRLFGADLVVTTGDTPSSVGAVSVVVAAVVSGAAAWLVHGWLARRPGGKRWWPFVGTTVLSASVAGPGYFAHGWDAVLLIVLHFAVGVVLIVGFGRAGRGRQPVAAAS